MIKYISRRLLLMIPTLIGITFITYSLVRLSSDNYSRNMSETMNEQTAAGRNSAIYKEEMKLFGLDKPIPIGYFNWIKKAAVLDFGNSRKDGRKVTQRIIEVLPNTIMLNLYSVFLIYIFSVCAGLYLAVKRGTKIDQISSVVFFIIYSIPTFWLALTMLTFFAGGEYLNLFPLEGIITTGFEEKSVIERFFNIAWHLTLPAISLSIGEIIFLTQFIRSNTLEVLNKQFIISARAKGLTEKRVIFVHAFRNSMIPLVTMIGMLIPSLFGGSVIIESIYSLPGLGMMVFEAFLSRDLPVIMAITMFSAVLTLLGILFSDILYSVVNPKIRVS
ncbi:MAG: ABC transporter permease [Spirochaetes bacterium]|nr:ABC transporter permease [Spirochaetota bacterium]